MIAIGHVTVVRMEKVTSEKVVVRYPQSLKKLKITEENRRLTVEQALKEAKGMSLSVSRCFLAQ